MQTNRTPRNNGQTEQIDIAARERKRLVADIQSECGQRILAHIRFITGCEPGKQRPAFERIITAPGSRDGIGHAITAAHTDGRKSVYFELDQLDNPDESQPAPSASR